MINVNLLKTKEPTAVMEPGTPSVGGSEKQGALAAIVILGLVVALIFFQGFTAHQTRNSLDREISDLQQEKARLQAIIAQVEEYQRKLALLEEKERLIQKLKNEREGPVRMLDGLSAQLPDFVWLTSLNQNATNVTIDGMAASYVSIADYIRKLEDSDHFSNVELIDARQDKEFTSFQLRSELVTPGAGGAAPAAAAAGNPAGSR